MIAMCDFQAARWTMSGEVPGQAGNDHPTSIPTGVFRTGDGYINIAAAGDAIFRRFCEAIDAADLATDDKFATNQARSANRDLLNRQIEDRIARYDSKTLIGMLNAAGVPAGPIYKMDQVFADPQVRHLGMAQPAMSAKLGRIDLVGQAIKLNRTEFRIRTAAPEQGEHTEAVLQEFGYDAAAIAGLRDRGIV
jgi:formyl-CoA transferase